MSLKDAAEAIRADLVKRGDPTGHLWTPPARGRKQVQAKHIREPDVLAAIRDISRARERWAHLWEIWDHFPEFPGKVVTAKLGAMIRKGLITGCTCGCRGDFELTEAGRELLRRAA